MVEKLSSGVSVTGLEGTLYGSKKASIMAKNRNELAGQSLENTIKTSPNELYSIHSLKGDYIKIAFEDERSKQLVSANLSLENVANLMLNFNGKDDFVMRSDGVLRLNGEAQNFVSGWFDKIAYEMNLLGADADKNGLVKGSELENTLWLRNPSLIATGRKAEGASLYTLFGGDLMSYEKASPSDKDRSIEALLNEFLSLDTNADNKITFEEYASKKGFEIKNTTLALRNLDARNAKNTNIFSEAMAEIDELLKKMREAAMKRAKKSDEEEEILGVAQLTELGMQALQGYEIEQKTSDDSDLKEAEKVLENGKNDLNNDTLENDLNATENALNAENSLASLTQNEGIANALSDDKNLENAKNLQTKNLADENLNANLKTINTKDTLNGDLKANSSKDFENNSNALDKKASLLKALESSLSKDLLAQIKNQNLKIIDLRA